MWRALARKVRKKEEPLAPRRRLGGLRREQFVRINLPFPRGGNFRLSQLIAIPLQTSPRRKDDSHDMPLAAHRVTERVQPALRIVLHGVAVGEDDAARPHRGRDHSLADDAIAYCS